MKESFDCFELRSAIDDPVATDYEVKATFELLGAKRPPQ
jgi:hypothetical protein